MEPFRWNAWNEEHVDRHGVSKEEAEEVIRGARRPYPKYQGDGRWLVRGQTEKGFYLQVVFIYSPPEVIYVIHARLLTENEKRRLRKRRK